MKYLKGDLLELAKAGRFDVIAHGCNCLCTMGAGIAKGIKKCFPAAYDADRQTVKGDCSKLGSCSTADILIEGGSLVVVNAYIQFDFRGSGLKADYAAVRSCIQWIGKNFPNKKIGLPRLGAGLAGGDWPTIETIIHEELRSQDVTVVEYQP